MATTTRSAAAASEDVVLELRDVTVRFGMSRGTSRVLDSVDLDVSRGEVVGVVGESGSGKSMLANALLDAVDDPGVLSGEVTYYPESGEPVDVLDLSAEELQEFRWSEIAFVVQGSQSGFNPTMTVGDHFRETLRANDEDLAEGMSLARDLLRDLYLDPGQVLDAYPHQLSGGMKQRTLIALSLVLEPEVLVLDEPTSALDLLMQRSIVGLLDTIQERYSLTLVFITHDLPLVIDLADRLAVMYAFDVVELGPTREILEGAAHPYTLALLNAVPNLSTPTDEMVSIEGSSPDPVSTPPGCSYNTRCPLADEHCRENEPPLDTYTTAEGDHAAACFYAEEAIENIPLSHHEEGPTEP
jgi:oligopeptide/dipeptide ABC transporter ATP-binding protein